MQKLTTELILKVIHFLGKDYVGIHTLLLTRKDVRNYLRKYPKFVNNLKNQILIEVHEGTKEDILQKHYHILPCGLKHGLSWTIRADLEIKRYYKDGVKDGYEKEYYKGKLRVKRYYTDGLKDGYEKYFTKDKRMSSFVLYIKGERYVKMQFEIPWSYACE